MHYKQLIADKYMQKTIKCWYFYTKHIKTLV